MPQPMDMREVGEFYWNFLLGLLRIPRDAFMAHKSAWCLWPVDQILLRVQPKQLRLPRTDGVLLHFSAFSLIPFPYDKIKYLRVWK